MLINYDKHINTLNDFRKGKVKEALKLGHKEIDSNFRFVAGNMNLLVGHNNVGKTHFTFYLMLLYSLKHNIRWLVFSSENDAVQLIKKLIEFIEGKPINKIEEKGTFRFRKLIVVTQEREEKYNQTICVDFVQNNTGLLDAWKVGDYVEVLFNLRGREWTNPKGEILYFTTLNGWKVEDYKEEVSTKDQAPDREDDLPF